MGKNEPESTAELREDEQVFGSAGFIVLDIVEPSRGAPQIHLFCGGTAGNTAVILSALGWQSFPFARLPRDDPAFPILAEDLDRFGVRPDFATLTPDAPFPVLIQRKRARGGERPLFTFRCPRCSSRWRGWSALTGETVKSILDRLLRFRFFLIDRYEPGNLMLAATAKQNGASVVFEPASSKITGQAESTRFRQALEIADILKYSAQQMSDFSDEDFPRTPSVEIQTRGSDGLRFRRRLQRGAMSGWEHLNAFRISNIEDPCGAGDWLTAMIIYLIGDRNIVQLSDHELREILSVGQAASSWACQFAGARDACMSTRAASTIMSPSRLGDGSTLPSRVVAVRPCLAQQC